jgi:hypothetical protein
LPAGEEVTGRSEFIVRSPAGVRLAIAERDRLDGLEITVDPARPVNLADAPVPRDAGG